MAAVGARIAAFGMIRYLLSSCFRWWKQQRRIARLQATFGARIDPTARIELRHEEDIVLADGVLIGAYSVLTIKSRDRATRDSSRLRVGDGTYIGEWKTSGLRAAR